MMIKDMLAVQSQYIFLGYSSSLAYHVGLAILYCGWLNHQEENPLSRYLSTLVGTAHNIYKIFKDKLFEIYEYWGNVENA